MERIGTLARLRATTDVWRRVGERIVLVPTMGALHAGHLALMIHARSLGQRVVASLFVNPTQFGPHEDFSRYPRDTANDIAKLETLGVDALWMPDIDAMYPQGFSTSLHIAGLTDSLCGAYRPGHFSGVATVVTKLLNQVRPDVAVFGEKDFQQLQVIRRVVKDLDLPVEIEGMPTIRDADGLALSSRNRYLSIQERAIAPRLNETLEHIAAAVRNGERTAPVLAEAAIRLEKIGFSPVQYVNVCDAATLDPVDVVGNPARVLAAVYLGDTRLIDNVPV